MTRKSFVPKPIAVAFVLSAIKLIAVALVLYAILLKASAAGPFEASVFEPNKDPRTVYITWQYPIPPSEKGDKLNVSVGVLLDGKTYASQDVFDILNIPKCPECPHCKGVTITVDGETGMYYPLRESAEQSGYSVLWAPNREEDGQKLDYWVYIAKKEMGTDWARIEWGVSQDGSHKSYLYVYGYLEDGRWHIDWDDEEQGRLLEENATVMEQ